MFYAGVVRRWPSFDGRLLIACVLAACLLLSHTLHRLLAPRSETHNPHPEHHP
jgi:hypothetical protein